MENKILSVSIAAYNVEKTLEEVLKPFCSIKNKNLLDVMVIDDGSKDRTKEIALEYVKKYPEMRQQFGKGLWDTRTAVLTQNQFMEEQINDFLKNRRTQSKIR